MFFRKKWYVFSRRGKLKGGGQEGYTRIPNLEKRGQRFVPAKGKTVDLGEDIGEEFQGGVNVSHPVRKK